MWDRGKLNDYRSQTGLPNLAEEEIDQVLAIINNLDQKFEPMLAMTWVEPEIFFSVGDRAVKGDNAA